MAKVRIEIHLIDTDLSAEEIGGTSMIEANCGETVPFAPIAAQWDDGRICPTCLAMHNGMDRKRSTFAVAVLRCAHPKTRIVKLTKVAKDSYAVARYCERCGSVGWMLPAKT